MNPAEWVALILSFFCAGIGIQTFALVVKRGRGRQ